MEDDGFGQTGFWIIVVIYVCYAPLGLVGAAVVNKLAPKWSMVVGAATFVPFSASFILPSLYKEYIDDHPGEKPTAGIL